MNLSFFTVGPTGSPHETRLDWSFCSNHDFATQPMEIRQVSPVLRHCLRHSRGDNRVGFPGSDRSQACGDNRGRSLAIIGSLALGWYGFLFGSVNRLRFGEMLGLVLGLLVGGLIGSVCGLIVLTLPWSLVGALIGGILGSNLTARHRPSLRPFFGTVLGICGGILVLAFQRDQGHARVGAISGSLIGVLAGIGAWLALIGALESDVEDAHGMGPVA